MINEINLKLPNKYKRFVDTLFFSSRKEFVYAALLKDGTLIHDNSKDSLLNKIKVSFPKKDQ